MKLAVLSDIHGNLYALNAILDDMKKYNPEKVLCLGDLAMAGPEPNNTINFVKTQDWTVIQGNTDEMIAYYFDTPVDECVKRVDVRNNLPGNLFLPLDVIKSYGERIIKPTLDEGFKKIIEIKNN